MADAAKIDIADVAKLARIQLSEAETQLFGAQLAQVLEFAAALQHVRTPDEDSTALRVPASNVFREDEVLPWFTAEAALRNAPRSADDLFVVTKVIE